MAEKKETESQMMKRELMEFCQTTYGDKGEYLWQETGDDCRKCGSSRGTKCPINDFAYQSETSPTICGCMFDNTGYRGEKLKEAYRLMTSFKQQNPRWSKVRKK